jgi:hypothetical protein
MKIFGLLLGTAVLLSSTPSVQAQETPTQDFWQFQTSAYTHHYSEDPDHNNHQKLIGIEYNDAQGWLYGGAAFRNSFDQATQYAYFGKRFASDSTPLYLKVSGGLLHGYRGDYKDKIPFNHFGIAPAIIPALGAHIGPATAELNVLGAAAIMLNVGWRVY